VDSGVPVAVTGVGVARMRRGGTPFHDLAHEAARRALADAALQRKDLDSVVLAGLDLECGRTISNMYAAPAAGGLGKDEIRVADDGLFAAALAWMRVRAGLSQTAMVLAYGQSSEAPPEQLANLVFDPVYQRPLGLGRLAPLALQAQAYRHAAPGADEAADALAARHRAAGARNPDALGLPPLAERDVSAASYAAAPLRGPHVAPLCDGAAALVVQARPARARAELRGFGWASESGDLGRRDLARSACTERAARDAYRASGLGVRDAHHVEVHDATAYQALQALEALGLAGRGAAPQRVREGFGPVQVNASGGALSGEPSVAGGLYRLAWCVRALRQGQAALVHGTSGPAAQTACVGVAGAWGA
jgi:acetyl-CoA C-acetyltransferase